MLLYFLMAPKITSACPVQSSLPIAGKNRKLELSGAGLFSYVALIAVNSRRDFGKHQKQNERPFASDALFVNLKNV